MRNSDIRGEKLCVFGPKFVKMRSYSVVSHCNDVWKRHFQQSFFAARDTEAARLHTAEGHTGIYGWNNEIIDNYKAARDLSAEPLSPPSVPRED
jgi:hypothetical protein